MPETFHKGTLFQVEFVSCRIHPRIIVVSNEQVLSSFLIMPLLKAFSHIQREFVNRSLQWCGVPVSIPFNPSFMLLFQLPKVFPLPCGYGLKEKERQKSLLWPIKTRKVPLWLINWRLPIVANKKVEFFVQIKIRRGVLHTLDDRHWNGWCAHNPIWTQPWDADRLRRWL